MLLTTAFKSEDPEEGQWLFMKSAHNHDRNEHTFCRKHYEGKKT